MSQTTQAGSQDREESERRQAHAADGKPPAAPPASTYAIYREASDYHTTVLREAQVGAVRVDGAITAVFKMGNDAFDRNHTVSKGRMYQALGSMIELQAFLSNAITDLNNTLAGA